MSTPSAKLLVFVSGHLACVKIVGRANFTSSIDFKLLLGELLQKNYSCLLIDLSECVLMDSTFLGVLSGFGLRMFPARDDQQNGTGIELLNPNARIAELLENLGVLHLFKVVNGPLALPAEMEAHAAEAAPGTATREEVTRNCLEAHRILMEISPANIPKFKEVAQFLAEDLQKPRTPA